MTNRKSSAVVSVRLYSDEHRAVLDLVDAINASPASTVHVSLSDVVRGVLLEAANEGASQRVVAAVDKYV